MKANEMQKHVPQYIAYKSVKDTSARKMNIVFENFFKFAGEQEVTLNLLRSWRVFLPNEENSKKQYFGIIAGLMEYLLDDEESGFTGKNYAKIVMKDIHPGERPEPKHFNLEEIREIFKKIKNPRDRVIMMTLFKTGCRNEECRYLKVTDVDLVNNILTFDDRKGRKATKKVTKFPIDKELAEHLRIWLRIRKSDSPYLFLSYLGSDMSDTALNDIFRKYTFPEAHAHMARHSTGTILSKNGCKDAIIAYLRGDSKQGRRGMVGYYDHSCDDPEYVRAEYLKAIPTFLQ